MAIQAREQLFFKVVLFFALLTAVTGILNMAAAGTLTLGNLDSMSNPGASIPGQIFPNVSSSSTAGWGCTTVVAGNDFTSSTGYNLSSVVQFGALPLGNPWTQENGVGYVLTGNWPYSSSQFVIAGVQPNANGVYDVTYNINDSVNTQFYVDIAGNPSQNYLQVAVTNSYVGIVNSYNHYVSNPSQVFFQASGDYVATVTSIETIYNPSVPSLNVIITSGSGPSSFSASTSAITFIGNPYSSIYAGVQAWQNGFAVEQINSAGGIITSSTQYVTPVVTGIPFIDAIIQAGGAILSSLGQFGALIATFLGLGTYSVVPFWLWAIFGLPCLAFIVIFGIEIARGD